MKPSWKHSQYYTFTQSFPTADLICVASIPAPSERLDGFFLCSSMHRNKEQMKSREVSGLPKSPSPGSACRGAGTGGTQHVLGLSPSAKHLHPLASYRAGMEVSELPKWSSCSRREGEEFSCWELFDFTEELRDFFFFPMFSLYEAPLKTAYSCCLYGVLPAANYSQVGTPNSC